MVKNNKLTPREEQEFNKLLEKLEDPNYRGGAYALPENANTLEKSKYELCQKILDYKLNELPLLNSFEFEVGVS